MLPDLEAIRSRIEATAQRLSATKAFRITASLGACSCPVREYASLDQLLAKADRSLYADKQRRKSSEPGAQ